jgi:hypothetical protein
MGDPQADDATVPGLDAAALADPVARLLGRPHTRVRDWHVAALGVGIGNPVSLGVYRVRGTIEDDSTPVSWSLVLKVVQSPANLGFSNMGEGPDQSHWNYWRREPLLLASDVLKDLPVGFDAPRFYGWSEHPGDVAWLWLEDLTDGKSGWSPEQHEFAAFQLGRFNGVYLAGCELPTHPWLSRRAARQMIGLAQQFLPAIEDRVPGVRGHPVTKFVADAASVLTSLENLPQTFCHLDAGTYNLTIRRDDEQIEQIVAIDWALAGIAPVGADLGQMAIDTNATQGFKLFEHESVLFDAYCAGLRDAGCHVDRDLIRFGYLTFMVCRLSAFFLTFLLMDLEQGKTPTIEDTNLPALAPYVEQVLRMVESGF